MATRCVFLPLSSYVDVRRATRTEVFGWTHRPDEMAVVPWSGRATQVEEVEDREGEPHSVVLTEIYDNDRGRKKITWLAGGLRAWIDVLEIDRDVLLEALL